MTEQSAPDPCPEPTFATHEEEENYRQRIEFYANPPFRWGKKEMEEYFRAMKESAEDDRRVHVTCYVGNDTEIVGTMTCPRGSPEEWIWQYEGIRRFSREIHYLDSLRSKSSTGYDVGSIEEKFFVLSDDCGALITPIVLDPVEPRNFWNTWRDEWNALFHFNTMGQTEQRMFIHGQSWYQEVLAIWLRLRIPYKEAFARVKAMQIMPKPIGQTYNWYDRSE